MCRLNKIILVVLFAFGNFACETSMPAATGLPSGSGMQGSSRVVRIHSPTIQPSQPGGFATYSYLQTSTDQPNIRVEGTMTEQVAPFSDPSLGSGVKETSTVVADRFDGFTKLNSIVITNSSSFVKSGSDAPTKLVAVNLNGDSRIITDPQGGMEFPLRESDLRIGLSYSYSYKAGFTYELSATGTVVAIENVNVPFGTIEVYKIIETATIDQNSNSSTSVRTAWMHPELGVVKQEIEATVDRSILEGGPFNGHLSIELISTNTPISDG